MRSIMPCFILILVFCGSLAWAQDLAELEVDHKITADYVTPHTKWAQPYAQGKTRALFFMNGRGTVPREATELTQRFDLEAEAVFWIRVIDYGNEEWLGGDLGVQRMLRLLDREWDVFVFFGIPFERLPLEAQYRVVKAVTDGAGIVMSGVDDNRILKDKNIVEQLPAFMAAGPVGDAFRVINGRGVRLPARPTIPYGVGWEVEYDYWQQRFGSAILWASGKDPAVELVLEQTQPEVQRAALPSNEVTIRWQDRRRTAGLTIEATLRRWDGYTISLGAHAVNEAQGVIPLEIPVVRAGTYYVDVIARSNRGVESYGSASFYVVSPRHVGEVVLDQDWAEIGETISGVISLVDQPSGADERVVLQVKDRRGRILVREDLGAAAGEKRFEFAVQPWMPMLLTVEGILARGDQELASAYTFANVTKRHQDQFNFIMWDYPKGTLEAWGQEALANASVTVQLASGPPTQVIAAYDISYIPYTTRIMSPKDEDGVMRPTCWNDEEGIRAHVDGIVEKQDKARQHGVYVYSLGDEGVTRGSCLSPHCLHAYQRYLQEVYGTIDALNDSWGTDFASFDTVVLSDPRDDDETKSLQEGNYPRWFDRQAFQSINFANLCRRFRHAFEAIDPKAISGFEGAGRLQDGDDVDAIIRANTFWAPYPGTMDEIIRSIAPRRFPRSNWMGYTKDADSLLEKYWRMIINNNDSVWWWRWDALGRFHGWLAPNFDPFPAVSEILADTQVVRDGLGDLMMNSQPIHDGVAMLFSHPSCYTNRIEGGPSYGSYERAQTAWHRAIKENALTFNYVSDRMLRLGEFRPREYKVMILAQVEAIGPQEAQVLRDFVQNGGILIADVRPGLYNDRCKPFESGILDDVFGVTRTAPVDAHKAALQASVEWTPQAGGPQWRIPVTEDSLTADGSVAADSATALATADSGAPLFLVNSYGQGTAILLNFALGSVQTTNLADMLEPIFLACGVEPEIKVLNAAGKPLRNYQISRWRTGGLQFFSIFRQGGSPEPIEIVLPQDFNAYNLRTREDLGQVSRLKTTVIPNRATFIGLSRRAVPGGTVQLDKARVAPGEVVTASLAIPQAAGNHAFKVRLKGPDGTYADWLEQVVVAGRDSARVQVPVAHNDPTGVWTVEAVELFTNRPAVARFTVQ